VPRVLGFAQEKAKFILVTDVLGKNLGQLFRQRKGFSTRTVQLIGYHMVGIIEQVHGCGVLHRDIKPENILVGSQREDQLFLCDFGISARLDPAAVGREAAGFVGTPRFASISAHRQLVQGRKDDLESLGYMLVFLAKKKLPWMNIKSEARTRNMLILEQKEKITAEILCRGLPPGFVHFLNAARGGSPH
jgi:serine/threonine protein kinase